MTSSPRRRKPGCSRNEEARMGWRGMVVMALAAGLGWTVLPGLARVEERVEKKEKNLVPNGDFEAGDDTPAGWQQVDGLTTFWVRDEDPKRGKVIRMDTDVYQTEAYAWWTKIALGAKAK